MESVVKANYSPLEVTITLLSGLSPLCPVGFCSLINFKLFFIIAFFQLNSESATIVLRRKADALVQRALVWSPDSWSPPPGAPLSSYATLNASLTLPSSVQDPEDGKHVNFLPFCHEHQVGMCK